jgi:hypothetical protein
MGAIYPLSVHRRVERQWMERIKSLGHRSLIVTATEQSLRRSSLNGSSIPVRKRRFTFPKKVR